MEKKLKLDLHTHCLEAVGFQEPTREVVGKIVEAIQAKCLDGIAITDHARSQFAFGVKAMVETCFGNQALIIPGQEIDLGNMEIVELFLPEERLFRFIAHPGYPGSFSIDGRRVQGIEVDNGGHNWNMDTAKITRFAQEHHLLLLKNSDAHYLEDIGRAYNELSWETLLSLSLPLRNYPV